MGIKSDNVCKATQTVKFNNVRVKSISFGKRQTWFQILPLLLTKAVADGSRCRRPRAPVHAHRLEGA